MATAKPKVKRMMGGGAAGMAASALKSVGVKASPSQASGATSRPMSQAKLALRDRPSPMPPPKKPIKISTPEQIAAMGRRYGAPNPREIAAGMGAGAARGMMKKGGAVKKATKK